MTNEEKKDFEREADRQNRLSRFIRSRLWAQELGVTIYAMDFRTGRAWVYFEPEQAPLLASMEGAA